jgi:hypothetical protein
VIGVEFDQAMEAMADAWPGPLSSVVRGQLRRVLAGNDAADFVAVFEDLARLGGSRPTPAELADLLASKRRTRLTQVGDELGPDDGPGVPMPAYVRRLSRSLPRPRRSSATSSTGSTGPGGGPGPLAPTSRPDRSVLQTSGAAT